jgi:hypothetical protein
LIQTTANNPEQDAVRATELREFKRQIVIPEVVDKGANATTETS